MDIKLYIDKQRQYINIEILRQIKQLIPVHTNILKVLFTVGFTFEEETCFFCVLVICFPDILSKSSKCCASYHNREIAPTPPPIIKNMEFIHCLTL